MYSKVKYLVVKVYFTYRTATKQFLYPENKDWLEILYCTTIIFFFFLEHNKSNFKLFFKNIIYKTANFC